MGTCTTAAYGRRPGGKSHLLFKALSFLKITAVSKDDYPPHTHIVSLHSVIFPLSSLKLNSIWILSFTGTPTCRKVLAIFQSQTQLHGP